MRRDESHFGDQELVLLYIAKRLREAGRLEEQLDAAGLDYLVEPDRYRGGVLFVRELIGAFFYSTEADAEAARAVMRAGGFTPYEAEAAKPGGAAEG
jgi:hypothetical protein